MQNYTISYFKGLFNQVAAMGGDKKTIDTDKEKNIASEMLKNCDNQRVTDFMQRYIDNPGKKLSGPQNNNKPGTPEQNFVKFDKRSLKAKENSFFYSEYLIGNADYYHVSYDDNGNPAHKTFFDKKGNVIAEENFKTDPNTGEVTCTRKTSDGRCTEKWVDDAEGNALTGERTIKKDFTNGTITAHQSFKGDNYAYEYDTNSSGDIVSITVPIEIGSGDQTLQGDFVCMVDNGKIYLNQNAIKFFTENPADSTENNDYGTHILKEGEGEGANLSEYTEEDITSLITEKLQNIQSELNLQPMETESADDDVYYGKFGQVYQ